MDTVTIPPELVQSEVERIHSGNCPVCKGPGPVDVYFSSWVQSFILITRWGRSGAVSCRPCRNKKWLQDTTMTVAMGWWGFPTGFVLTPITLLRNGWEFYFGPKASTPSKRLDAVARQRLGSAVAAATQLAASLECPRCKTGFALAGFRDGSPDIRCSSCGEGLPTRSASAQVRQAG
jgi:hypothetical protein